MFHEEQIIKAPIHARDLLVDGDGNYCALILDTEDEDEAYHTTTIHARAFR